MQKIIAVIVVLVLLGGGAYVFLNGTRSSHETLAVPPMPTDRIEAPAATAEYAPQDSATQIP